MRNNINKIFKKRTCLSAAELEGYARNTLRPRERNQVERHLLDCELCSEALEGFLESGKEINLIKMKSMLAHRFVSKSQDSGLQKTKSSGWIWAAAAVICIALVSGAIWKFNRKQTDDLASVTVKDSIYEPVQSLTLSRKERAESTGTSKVAEEKAITRQEKSTEIHNLTAPVEQPVVFESGKAEAANLQEATTALVATDEVKSEEKQTAMQPPAREMYGNAYKQQVSDNNAAAMNQSAIKKKSVMAASGSSPEKDLTVSWNEIIKLGEAGQYQKALLALDQLTHEKDEVKTAYYKGYYLYKSERYNEALLQFEKVRKDKTHVNYNDAQFYRALSLLSIGKNKEGKEILNRIVNEKLPHHEHAAETLRLLD